MHTRRSRSSSNVLMEKIFTGGIKKPQVHHPAGSPLRSRAVKIAKIWLDGLGTMWGHIHSSLALTQQMNFYSMKLSNGNIFLYHRALDSLMMGWHRPSLFNVANYTHSTRATVYKCDTHSENSVLCKLSCLLATVVMTTLASLLLSIRLAGLWQTLSRLRWVMVMRSEDACEIQYKPASLASTPAEAIQPRLL